jgi:hypothetical protein
MTRVDCRRLTHSKWVIPVSCAVFGGVVLLASWLGGQLIVGFIGLVIMVGFGLIVALAGGSETVRGLRGDGRDERFAQIDLRATAVAGTALIIAVIAAFIAEIARGHNGSPYDWLGAIGGLAYVLAVAYFRWRG